MYQTIHKYTCDVVILNSADKILNIIFILNMQKCILWVKLKIIPKNEISKNTYSVFQFSFIFS